MCDEIFNDSENEESYPYVSQDMDGEWWVHVDENTAIGPYPTEDEAIENLN